MLTIGDRGIVCKDAFFNCYRAQSGLIQTGPVSLGRDSFVGEMTVLDIETTLGDGAQLGHSSSLHTGQSIPDGERMGCARYMRERHRTVRIVAVDAVGSVTFGSPPASRKIPGLGMGVRPPLLDESHVDEVIFVEESDTIRACHHLAGRGFLFGGSTGTVVSAAISWLAEHGTPGLTSVAIAPDLGERYLDSVYQSSWVNEHYGEKAFGTPINSALAWNDTSKKSASA